MSDSIFNQFPDVVVPVVLSVVLSVVVAVAAACELSELRTEESEDLLTKATRIARTTNAATT